jgi:unsaturated rhamnogalacturonyl hydrolase
MRFLLLSLCLIPLAAGSTRAVERATPPTPAPEAVPAVTAVPAADAAAVVAVARTGPWSARVTDSIIARSPDPSTLEGPTAKWTYATAFEVFAIARAAEASGDPRYLDYCKKYVDLFVDDGGAITHKTFDPHTYKLDDIAPGRLMLLMHKLTGEARYRTVADTLMKQLETQPRTSEGGFWHKQIYPHQMWLDGIYMASPVMAEYSSLAGQPQWLDEAAKQILLIASHTRDAKTGLYFHGWDESRQQAWANKQTGLSPCLWGRSVGWYMLGIVETLDAMPADHPKRAEIVKLFRDLSDAVIAVQDGQSKLWYQVLDQPTREGNYLESSASAMFVYAMAKGARMQLLDAKHLAAARAGYDGMLERFVKVDSATGQVSLLDTCQVAGLGGQPRRDGSFAYYIGEPRIANDPKGLAPFILASLEMERATPKQRIATTLPSAIEASSR